MYTQRDIAIDPDHRAPELSPLLPARLSVALATFYESHFIQIRCLLVLPNAGLRNRVVDDSFKTIS
jgi:hypothetical protein